MHITKVDIVTSTNCKFQLQFGQTNYYQHLFLTSSTYFQSASVPADVTQNTSTAESPNVGCNADAKHSNELAVGRKSDKPKTEIKREDIL